MTSITTVADIQATIKQLRRAHENALSALTQSQVVEMLCQWARQWRKPVSPPRGPFPFSHVQVSLDALMESLTPERLHALIDAEDVRDLRGPDVVGHVIAGNTPLLAWVSVLRALVMRSASMVKLPSGEAGEWGHLFLRSLTETAPALASCVMMRQWPGGTPELDSAFCNGVDLIMAHGSDSTIEMLRAITPPQTPFVGFGHAISFALVLPEADWETAIPGLARDILLYDGGGCLSVRTVFVRGNLQLAGQFASCLSQAMGKFVQDFGLPERTSEDWNDLNTARTLGELQPGAGTYSKMGDPYAVLLWPLSPFRIQTGAGVVCVQPWSNGVRFQDLLKPVAGCLQGCALAGDPGNEILAPKLGISRVCAPGALQAPPFAWRQDGRDVLRLLLKERAA